MTKNEYQRERNRRKRHYPECCLAKHDTCFGCTFAAFEGFDPGCYFAEHKDKLHELMEDVENWRARCEELKRR